MNTQELVDRYGLDQLSRPKLVARREAARLHASNIWLPEHTRNIWAVVVALCDARLS